MVTRAYTSAVREESARHTKRVIASAAAELFLRDGYPQTSVLAVARAAGVSTQTVYNSFGTKAGLLKHVYDVTLVGDDDPVPFAERAEVRALYELTDPRDFLAGYAAIGVVLFERLGPLLGVITAGAQAGEEDLTAHLRRIDAERLTGVTMVVQHLRTLGGLAQQVSQQQARDAIWTLNSLAVWQLLTVERGWSPDAYAAWVGRAMADAVLAR
ncbi:MAG TPA: TetR/AcrR family transcriptional regulator [Propionibacteriaceae bacterium]